MKEWLPKSWRILKYSMHQFKHDGCVYRASALTFETLISLVPLLAVSFTVVSSFPGSEQFVKQIKDFLFTNLLASHSQEIEKYILSFVEQIHNLSALGIMFLVFSALLTLFTIEHALNDIWRVRERRHGLSAFLMYWAVLTLVPILLGLSLAISSYLISLPLFAGTIVTFGLNHGWQLSWLPTLFVLSIFIVLYMAVPNCKVRFKNAFIGALVATFLLEIAKYAFALYIRQFDTYQLIYGAFATIPIFFLWLHLMWFIILFGAEIAHACSLAHIKMKRTVIDPFTQAFCWLQALWRAQKQGKGLTLQSLVAEDEFTYTIEPAEMTNYLIEKKLIKVAEKEELVLARDLGNMTFGEFKQILPWRCPFGSELSSISRDTERLQTYLEQREGLLATVESKPLVDLLKGTN